MDFDTRVKLRIYQTVADTTRPPLRRELAQAFDVPEEEVEATFRRLREKKLIALAPATSEIVMAPPFSAAPTPFSVIVEDKRYFGNCIWDAFGIAAALNRDAEIEASCGCCGEPACLAVRDGKPGPSDWLAHFAVPARHWWDDITFT